MTHCWPLIITSLAYVVSPVGWEAVMALQCTWLVWEAFSPVDAIGDAEAGGGEPGFPHAAEMEWCAWPDAVWLFWCGQMEAGGSRRRKEEKPASSLPWCELATSPLQAVTTTAMRPVTPRMKGVQGPTFVQFLPALLPKHKVPLKHWTSVVRLLKASRNCWSGIFVIAA